MNIIVKPNNDPVPLAVLNETVQNIHYKEYPHFFKPYNYESALLSMTENLSKENWFSFLAFCEGKHAGYILFYIRDYKENSFRKSYRAVHIDQICVKSDIQRNNIGTRLMEAVKIFADENQIIRLELTFWEKNIHAKEFYKKQGFKRLMNFISKDI